MIPIVSNPIDVFTKKRLPNYPINDDSYRTVKRPVHYEIAPLERTPYPRQQQQSRSSMPQGATMVPIVYAQSSQPLRLSPIIPINAYVPPPMIHKPLAPPSPPILRPRSPEIVTVTEPPPPPIIIEQHNSSSDVEKEEIVDEEEIVQPEEPPPPVEIPKVPINKPIAKKRKVVKNRKKKTLATPTIDSSIF